MNFTDTIKLGEKLVKELTLEDGVDTLGRWMAHYIAELIEKAKLAEGEVKIKYERECADTILKLWTHIDKVPNMNTPLRSFSNISNVLEKITTTDKFRYFPEKYKDEENIYLLLAQKVDSLTKTIVQHSFILAIAEASEKEKEWLQFDMLDDVININKVIIEFEDDVEFNDGIVDISETEKKKLLDEIEEFKKILELINIPMKEEERK